VCFFDEFEEKDKVDGSRDLSWMKAWHMGLMRFCLSISLFFALVW
jgi:hypothetical protein